jgi:hypothetical protein
VQPLLATLTRLLVAGALGSLALGVLGWGIDSLFGLMACGLVLYGLVMVVVMRRELGIAGIPFSPLVGEGPRCRRKDYERVLMSEAAH